MSPYEVDAPLNWRGMFKDLMLGVGALGLFLMGAGVLRSISTNLHNNAALVWFFTRLALVALAGIANFGPKPDRVEAGTPGVSPDTSTVRTVRGAFRTALDLSLIGLLFAVVRLMR